MPTQPEIERAVIADAGLAVKDVAVRQGKPGEVRIWIVLKPGCTSDARRIAEINAEHAARAVAAAGVLIVAECVDRIPEPQKSEVPYAGWDKVTF